MAEFDEDLSASVEEVAKDEVLRRMYSIMADHGRDFEEKVSALLELGRSELQTAYGTLSKIEGEDYIFEFVDADDDSIQAGDVGALSATNCELAASNRETLVLGDVERDAPEETDRAGFTDWGIVCYIGAPIFDHEDKVYGTFCFYDTEAREGQFSEWEETLVDLMARWISYELQNKQVTDQLHQQNERLEEFVNVVSHDLRNPLSVASGNLELVRQEYNSRHLDAIERAHDRMDALISDLLTLAREGDSAIDSTTVDLAKLTQDCWRNVDTGHAALEVTLTGTIRADEGRLKQLFENLIRNAIEHGGDAVTVTVGVLDDGFYIEDDGPGIAEDEREDIFTAGYSTSDGGTGFGLSIVKRVVEAHDWEIRVIAGSEGGARFEITDIEFVD